MSAITQPLLPKIVRRSDGIRSLLLATGLVFLAGCAVAPLPALKPSVPDTWRHGELAPGATPQADLRHWWTALGDPQLDALIDRALHNNLDVAQAAERVRSSRILNRHSHDGYLPSLHGRTNDVINPDTSASYFLVGFDAVWELPLFGAWQSTSRQAQGQENLARAELQGARVSLVAEVTRKWIELRSAQQQLRLLGAIRDTQAEKLRLVQVRAGLKLAPQLDVAHAQAELARTDEALAEPQQAIIASAQQLAVLVGQNEPDPQWLQAGPQPQLGAWELQTAPADLLRTRPEIASAEANVLRAAGDLGLSRAAIYPNIGLGTSLQWSINITSNYNHIHSGEGIASSGPIIDIPLFDWGQRVSLAHAKDHDLKAALLAYRQAVLQGVAEAETAMGDLQQLQARESASQQALQAVQQGGEIAHKRVELNLGSTLEWQDSQLESHRAELELVSARAARDLAYVALYKALGGAPLPDDSTPAGGTSTAGHKGAD